VLVVRTVPDRERGASSMEWALLTPVLILVILLVIQFTMVYHARHVALAAAQAGARLARSEPAGTDWRGRAQARSRQSIAQIGPGLFEGAPDITAGEADGGSGDQRFVEVSGQAVQVVPFLKIRVRQRSQGPVECFRPDDGGTDCE
jgi:TadE-like protein